MSNIMSNTKFPLHLKKKAFKHWVIPVMALRSDTWTTVTMQITYKLETVQSSMERSFLRITQETEKELNRYTMNCECVLTKYSTESRK